MKRIIATLLTGCLCFGSLSAGADDSEQAQFKTREQWKAAYVMSTYIPNQEIKDKKYDAALAALCVNGTFIGKLEGDVRVWRGIPYAKQPLGALRFKEPQPVEASDRVFEAYHFMKSSMQSIDPEELSSVYEQGEDCLGLNIWSSTKSASKSKAVLVFIHGGGWMGGGTSDPLYNGHNFANNNPDVLLVTVDYRLGMLGQINLSSFPDGKDYPNSEALCILDLVQALKWIKENIASFGGDPDNVTISGESAGGGAVSELIVLNEAKGLFSKAIPMSGSVAQFSEKSETSVQVSALREAFGCKSVADLQKIPFDRLRKWWGLNVESVYHHPVRGNALIDSDPFKPWIDGSSAGITVLQGHTANEFHYYLLVFGGLEAMYDAVCEGTTKDILQKSGKEYANDYAVYEKTLHDLGYGGKDIYRAFMDDHAFNSGNIYQAEMHAKNGGKGFFYTFEKGYDDEFAPIGAGHAADCYYMFGNFDGVMMLGTPEEVELSGRFQRMIANFCRSGDPSADGLVWPEYSGKLRYRMMIGENMRVEENPEKARVDAIMKMMDSSDLFRFTGNEGTMVDNAAAINPKAVEECLEIWRRRQM